MPNDLVANGTTQRNGSIGSPCDGCAAVRDVLLMVVFWLPLAPATAASPRGATPGRADIVAILSDDDAPRYAQERAWSAIDRLGEPTRDATLRDLVAVARETYALSAAHVLIYGGAVEIDALVSDRILSFSDESRTSVLRAIVLAERAVELGRVPRRLLEHLIERTAPPEAAEQAVDVAAVLVAAGGDAAAMRLLRQSIRRCPWSRGLWTGLAMRGGAPVDNLPLALSVQIDTQLPMVVRTAAAVAVAAHVDSSAAFAEESIAAYVHRFGPMTLEAIAGTLGAPEADVYDEFWDDLRLVGMLRHLAGHRALDVAIEALGVENEAIRQVAAAVIVERWPKHLLSAGRGRLGESEHAALLVILGVRHPTLRARASARLPAAQLDEALERLSEFGEIGLLEWAGPVMAGF